MRIDEKTAKIGITVLGTFATTIITVAGWFHSSIGQLNSRINDLSQSITTLDKNLAVQTAIFEQYVKMGGDNAKRDIGNKKGA